MIVRSTNRLVPRRAAALNAVSAQSGFSLVEMLIALTVTLVIVSIAFFLLAQSFNRKARNDKEADALSDADQAMSWISREVTNSGFGLSSNGLVSADCTYNKIRIRANLNALLKETTSGTVADQDEDVEYYLVANAGSPSSLVRSDVGRNETTVIATQVDDVDVDNDGIGDGLKFDYLDAAGTAVTPSSAVRVRVTIRIILPQVGVPGSPGFQPKVTKTLSSTIVLRNARLVAY